MSRRKLAAVLTVATLCATGVVFLLVRYWPAIPAAEVKQSSPACITVETIYPGASAEVIAEAVAAPIEQQVNGVEGMLWMASQSSASDGTYTLTVAFKNDADLNMSQIQVQNRVNLALPSLPNLVQQRGVNVKKKPPSVLLFVSIAAPDGRFDTLYLSNYAAIQVKDELARLPGVGDVGLIAAPSQAKFDGKPVALLSVALLPGSRPQEARAAVMAKLRTISVRAPVGIAINVALDFTSNLEPSAEMPAAAYLRLDIALPSGASIERTFETVSRCEAIVQRIDGVEQMLSLCGRPFTLPANEACLLVRLAPAENGKANRTVVMDAIRTRIGQEIQDATSRVSDLSEAASLPDASCPIDLAIVGNEFLQARQVAEQLAKRLRETEKLTDIWLGPGAALAPQVIVEVDRARAAAVRVSITDIVNELQVAFGPAVLNDANPFGNTGRVTLRGDGAVGDRSEAIGRRRVRNAQGELVPLKSVCDIRLESGATVLERLNLRPMVGITANLAPGVGLKEARSLCENLAKEICPAECWPEWRGEKPSQD